MDGTTGGGTVQRATFEINGERYEGFHDPTSTWNGFANPYLREADMPRFLSQLVGGDHGAGFGGSYWAKDGTDYLYCLVTDDGDMESSESFGPDEDGLYAVGFGYCWEVVS